MCLNPRFDGAFLNLKYLSLNVQFRLNPRFDGAFLNCSVGTLRKVHLVLIPDLMGLF